MTIKLKIAHKLWLLRKPHRKRPFCRDFYWTEVNGFWLQIPVGYTATPLDETRLAGEELFEFTVPSRAGVYRVDFVRYDSDGLLNKFTISFRLTEDIK